MVYMPYGLDVFVKLAALCKNFKEKLEGEIRTLIPSPTVLTEFSPTTPVGQLLAKLRHDTPAETIESLAIFSEADARRLAELEELVTEFKTSDPKLKTATLKRGMRRIETLLAGIEGLDLSLSDAKVEVLRSLHNEARAATVVVTTDNSNGKLLPYLTANVQFEMDQRSEVLLAPNAALRWKPQASQVDPLVSKTAISGESTNTQDRGCLWVEADAGFVRPLEVLVGVSDGTMTEIGGSGVKEGMQIIVGEEGQADAEGQDNETTADGDKTSNPFLPKPPKGSRPPPGPMM